jgi:DNA repair protein RadC
MRKENELRELKVLYTSRKREDLKEKITTSERAYELLLNTYDKNTISCQEQFNVLFLNNANQPLGIYKASKGGITGTIADIRLILGMALKSLATGLILSHNHPSGNLKPSDTDIQLTKKFKEACLLLDINLLDHIIISPYNEKFSFADKGLMSY